MNVLKYFKNTLLPQKKEKLEIRCETASSLPGDEEKSSSFSEIEIINGDKYEDGVSPVNCGEKMISFKERTPQSGFAKKNFIPWFRSQEVDVGKVDKLEKDEYTSPSPLDTFIGYAVEVAGTVYVLGIVLALLIAWIVWGVISKGEDTWQIVMQDGQSIQTYVWNTFLMRQQLDNDERLLLLYGRLKSRSLTHKRLIKGLMENSNTISNPPLKVGSEIEGMDEEKLINFKSENLFDRISYMVEKVLGSLPAITIYWMGIFVWIGCGAVPLNQGTPKKPDMQKFSNTWQMYVNTATAIELLVTTVFLENVRNRTNAFILKQTEVFDEIDAELERLLREINSNDSSENELVVVERCPRDGVQKVISFYAHVVGNGLGLVISVCVFSTWLGIGNVMHWNANWWLVIGTYTGLMGFIDGFVLREIFYSITHFEQDNLFDLLADSQEWLDLTGIPVELEKPKIKKTLGNRISLFINRLCSNKWSVVLALLIVLGLVILASALLWSETAQLIANTPTMIVEGSFLLILVQAHDWACEERRRTLSELNKSRILLYDYVRIYQMP